jgi:hypothetical protein
LSSYNSWKLSDQACMLLDEFKRLKKSKTS